MKSRAFPYAFVALLVCGGGAAWLQCGNGSTCGNMKVEDGEQCDKGTQNGVDGSGCSSSCQFANVAVATIQVSYSKLLNEVPGFNGVTCNDLGIGGAHVVLSGPQPADEMWMGCNAVQAVLERDAGDVPGDDHAARRAMERADQPGDDGDDRRGRRGRSRTSASTSSRPTS